ncbi:MAG: hypothetical protein QXP70_02090 [Methanomassiliicoccales archaeon]
MSIFRREYDAKRKSAVYHCDEHAFSSSDASHVEEHLRLHGKRAAAFWKKRHDREKGVTVFSCEHHDFESTDPLEIEEHEKIHAIVSSGWGINR